ncbi:putative uncharacterized protein [Parachlamydia acanthamoebae UV-7]|uniref:Uncharacterized protein n=3 Tax=Parachlamydia acanthamoebae TaxID=83552 RepID=F8L014_PARAV|nr:hypothetical protein [Parachlamydia acanthamoebae]KIA77726.1 hypothetical protein DB43_FU00020 [Parachlamydia acanthamoebae]CCB86527.1 putative uncharacterized protein [Parachlamydia acanthamoebae UV-7]
MKNFIKIIYGIVFFLTGVCNGMENIEKIMPFAKIVATTSQQRSAGAAKHMMIMDGFPINEDLAVSFARGLQLDPHVYQFLEKIQIDEKGMISIDGEGKLEGYGLNLDGIARGERVKCRVCHPNGSILTEASYIPKPIRKKSKEKTFSIEAELLGVFPTTYFFKCKGLEEGEILKIRSTCVQEVLETDVIYHEAQPIRIAPDLENKRGGISLVQIIRANGDKLGLRLKWGNMLLDEAQD